MRRKGFAKPSGVQIYDIIAVLYDRFFKKSGHPIRDGSVDIARKHTVQIFSVLPKDICAAPNKAIVITAVQDCHRAGNLLRLQLFRKFRQRLNADIFSAVNPGGQGNPGAGLIPADNRGGNDQPRIINVKIGFQFCS